MNTNTAVGMGHQVVAAENINKINDYNFFVTGGHVFDSFAEGIRFSIEYHYALLVKGENYEGVRIALLRDSDGYRLHLALLKNDFSAKICRDYRVGVRMTEKKINGVITDIVLAFLAEVEKIAEDMTETEAINDAIAPYQAECDGYVDDLKMVADSYDELDTKMAVFAAKSILKKIKKLSDDCLTAIGDVTECDMVWDDGWHLDLTSIAEWWCGRAEAISDCELETIINDLYGMLGVDYDMPLADDYTMAELEEDGELTWLHGGMPIYLYDEIRDFTSTYYHYAYCA